MEFEKLLTTEEAAKILRLDRVKTINDMYRRHREGVPLHSDIPFAAFYKRGDPRGGARLLIRAGELKKFIAAGIGGTDD